MKKQGRSGTIRGTNSSIEEAARTMRKAPTEAEALLWESLRKRRLAGLRFRRQHPVGRFVLDFFCPERGLVVEVDGSVHEGQPGRDAARDRFLAAAGYHTVRVRNDEVFSDLLSVLCRIATAAEANATSAHRAGASHDASKVLPSPRIGGGDVGGGARRRMP